MGRKLSIFLTMISLWLPVHVHAQAWSGIINPTRAANWQRANVGVPGGVPTISTQCGSTIAAYTGAATAINNAIAACGSNQFVLLGPGTFNLSSAIILSTVGAPKSNVVIRGSGPNQTILNFTGGAVSCSGGRTSDICAINGNGMFGAGANSANVTPPCGGSGATNCFNVNDSSLPQGATSVTISNVGAAGIRNGDQIILDQGNETADNGGFFTCDTLSPTVCHQNAEVGSGNGRIIGGLEYSQQQFVTVVSGCTTACSGAGPFTITFSPGIYANNWNGHVPMAGWFVSPVTNLGVENLTVDNTNGTATGGNIGFYNCWKCWIKNVRSVAAQRSHVWLFQSANTEVRDSYFYGSKSGGSQSYGIEIGEGGGSAILVENNIFHQVSGPIVLGGSSGTVVGYNYSIDNVYTPSTYMQYTSTSHDTADTFNLYEGNAMNGFSCDDIHGTANASTYFRNRLNGRDYNTAGGALNQPTQQTFPIELLSYCRAFNIIGNVLGTPGYHTNYEQFPPTQPSASACNTSIYELGWGGGLCGNLAAGGVANDPLVRSTLMRWGNYDAATNTVRWDATESSPAAATYIGAQVTPASHVLPASFYLPAKPTWWGTVPYPAIGPDVSGGNGPGGFSFDIPARRCYAQIGGTVDGSGNPLPFDANTCYTSSGGQTGAPPAPVVSAPVIH